jgi:cellulose synthase operon protein C
MSDLCARVHEFADGELVEASAGSFEWHLAACSGCQDELESILAIRALALESLGDPTRTSSTAAIDVEAPARARARRTRRILLAGAPALAAAGLLLMLGTRPGGSAATDPLVVQAFAAFGDRGERPLSERLAYAAADRHRPAPRVMRGARGVGAASPEALARLQEAGDQHGEAALWMAAGEWDRAATILDGLPASPEIDNDRAVLDMHRERLDAAEARLRRVVRDRPDLTAARWNLALIQQRRGDLSGAAQAFAAIAARHEPGWADEAKRRAAELAPF